MSTPPAPSAPAVPQASAGGPPAAAGGSPAGAGVSPARIMGVATQYWQSALLLNAVKLDLFSKIPDTGITGEDLATECGFASRHLEMMLNALAAHEFLEKRGDAFFNAGDTGKFLDRKKPSYMGNALAYALDQYGPWGDLEKMVRDGAPAVSPPRHLGMSPEKTGHFVRAMHERGLQIGPALVAPFDLSGCASLLDMGGGSGALSLLLIRKYPGLSATVLDLPAITEQAETVTRGLSGRESLRFAAGSYFDDLSGLLGEDRFDAVLLSGQMHQESLEDARKILANAKSRLKPHGKLYLVDIMTEPGKNGPRFSTLFGLNMALTRPNGGVHSVAEMQAAGQEAGLTLKASGSVPLDLPYFYLLFSNS